MFPRRGNSTSAVTVTSITQVGFQCIEHKEGFNCTQEMILKSQLKKRFKANFSATTQALIWKLKNDMSN